MRAFLHAAHATGLPLIGLNIPHVVRKSGCILNTGMKKIHRVNSAWISEDGSLYILYWSDTAFVRPDITLE